MVLLFDFDGTLADTFNVAFSAAERIFGKDQKFETVRSTKELMRSMSIHQLMKHLHISIFKIPSMISRMRAELTRVNGGIEPFYGICDVLRELHGKGCRLGIVSSNTEENVQKFLARHDLAFFEFGSYSTNIFSKKRSINRLIRHQGLSKREVVYIGDTVEDVLAAKASQVRAVAVSWGYASAQSLMKAKPDHIAETPGQLLEILVSEVALSNCS